MLINSTRRTLLAAAAGAPFLAACNSETTAPAAPAEPRFRLSLAQWSLHRRFYGGTFQEAMAGRSGPEFVRAMHEAPETAFRGSAKPEDFPIIAKQEFGISAVEYVNRFYFPHAGDSAFFQELRSRCDGEGVTSVLIMCDDEGALGDPDEAARAAAVANHHKWIDAAAILGCHSIRVNAQSSGTPEEQARLAADGLHRLAEYGEANNINVIVENHGGLSSNGQWLAGVLRAADHPRVGALPDFGNFRISDTEQYDPYQGVTELMPFAKGVSAKCHDFDAAGNETVLDFPRLMQIVKDANYSGYVGIEYEGSRLSEADGINAAKALLERIFAELEAA
jgi:L-ribulose-5-phosphate 3-epimerase